MIFAELFLIRDGEAVAVAGLDNSGTWQECLAWRGCVG